MRRSSRNVSGESYLNGLMSVKKELNKRDKLLCKARKSNEETWWKQYKKQRNRCNNKIRAAKARYYQRILNDALLNPRNFWNTIKAVYIVPTK